MTSQMPCLVRDGLYEDRGERRCCSSFSSVVLTKSLRKDKGQVSTGRFCQPLLSGHLQKPLAPSVLRGPSYRSGGGAYTLLSMSEEELTQSRELLRLRPARLVLGLSRKLGKGTKRNTSVVNNVGAAPKSPSIPPFCLVCFNIQ